MSLLAESAIAMFHSLKMDFIMKKWLKQMTSLSRKIWEFITNTKRNPMEYKQPQEDFCSNEDCFNEVAKFSWKNGLVDDELLKNMNYYCGRCISEKRTL